jgi:superfamily I DNA/RNA helicase
VAVMLDALGIPHSPVATQPLFQSAVGMDVYSYLQVILFPEEARTSDFERILKRPNKYLTNQLIAQANKWTSFWSLPSLATLRDWERQKLLGLINQIERVSLTARLGDTAADCMQRLKTDFGLAEFYREQSRLSDDLDQASDEGLLDVITALAANYKTPLEFYQFICKSMADADASSDGEKNPGDAFGPEPENPNANEVYLSTIHRAKGKEFRNVVYFNLSQSEADPKQAAFIEEERRVAYVGATRPKDDLLITFASTKPSDFLWEIALNPEFRDIDEDELKRRLIFSQLQLERAKVVLQQLEARKQDQIGFFRELTKRQSGQEPTWLRWLLNKIQLWRIDRALARIEDTDRQIKTHKEATIAPLEGQLHAMAEEGKMRARLLGKTGRNS